MAITCINLLNQFDMKIKMSLLVAALFAVSELYGQVSYNCVANVMLSGYSERAYTSQPVTDQQLDLILKCGIKAPSGRNNQPWKFTVIKDLSKVKDLFRSIDEGNVVIIISGLETK